MSDYTTLYNVVSNENKMLSKTIGNTQDVYSTDNQNYTYHQKRVEWVKKINYYLFILYFILLIILVSLILINQKYSYLTFFIVFLMVIYPFFIEKIELFLWNSLKFILYLFIGKPYDPSLSL
jgi:hypothetical protein